MPAVEIRPDMYWVGGNDRTTDLFEGLWPISREGVSYNSFVIKDEKTAVVDLAMFGSYGWTGGALRDLVKIVEPVKWNLVDSLEIKGGAKPESIAQAQAFGTKFARTLKADADVG